METALFKNVNNLKIKGGSFNINQGPATFNDNRTIYNNDRSQHITNNAPVQNYDNRQYSTNYGFVLMVVLINAYQSMISFTEAIPIRDLTDRERPKVRFCNSPHSLIS